MLQFNCSKYPGIFVHNVILLIIFSVVMLKLTKVELDFERKQEVDIFMSTFVQYMNNYNANIIGISYSITLLIHIVQSIIGIRNINRPSPEYFISCSEIAMFNSSFPSGNFSILSPNIEIITDK